MSGLRIPSSANDFHDKYFPVKAFFNAITDGAFVRTLENISEGIGASFNDAHCEFPGDLEPEEETFEGVRFALFEDEIVVDFNVLYMYLKKASIVYCDKFPSEKEKVENLIVEICNRYNIKIERTNGELYL